MSESETEQEVEGISWEYTLEDRSLAEAQRKLELEFGVDFEGVNHGEKGLISENGLPFYAEVDDTVTVFGEEVDISVERDNGLNTVSLWVDDPEVMDNIDEYFEQFTDSNDGEPMVEPYKFRGRADTDVLKLLVDFTDHFSMEGPTARPGNGQVREAPIRRENMSREFGIGELGETVLEDGEEEPNYTGREVYIPGDSEFDVLGIQEDRPEYLLDGDFNVSGKIRISPVNMDSGVYRIEVDGDDKESQNYMINRAARTLD